MLERSASAAARGSGIAGLSVKLKSGFGRGTMRRHHFGTAWGDGRLHGHRVGFAPTPLCFRPAFPPSARGHAGWHLLMDERGPAQLVGLAVVEVLSEGGWRTGWVPVVFKVRKLSSIWFHPCVHPEFEKSSLLLSPFRAVLTFTHRHLNGWSPSFFRRQPVPGRADPVLAGNVCPLRAAARFFSGTARFSTGAACALLCGRGPRRAAAAADIPRVNQKIG